MLVMETREKEIYKVTLIGSAVNAVLIVLKFIAGIVGHSSALVADAVHSLSDFVTDVIVLVFVRLSGKPFDRGHGYGHGKFETMATMVIGLILALAGIALFINGARLCIDCILGRILPQPTVLALVIAIVSIFSKEWLYRYTVACGRRLQSQAVMANAWHHRSDALSSLGTLVGVGGAMFLGARWRILDPLAAVAVSVFIVKSGYEVMKPSIAELLEASLSEDDEKEICDIVLGVHGIGAMHRLRTRRIGNVVAVDFHAKMDGGMSLRQAHSLVSEAERRLKKRFGQSAIITIHMEPINDV